MMELNGEWGTLPVMALGDDDIMCFSFDEMSHTYHRFTYRVTHCDAYWNPSDISEIDYLDGFNGMPIEEWENSVNTTMLYTRYTFSLPNEDIRLLLSGNYKVEVFDDDEDSETPVLVYGFSVVEQYTGHGVGAELHEDPNVPNYGTQGRGVRIYPGMTLAIEPMINEGTQAVKVLNDQWTVVTADGKLSAHYEHSVAVTNNGIILLTKVD